MVVFIYLQHIITMTNEDDDVAGYRRAVHCAVLQANDTGAPSGQHLEAPAGSGQGTSSASGGHPEDSTSTEDPSPTHKAKKRVRHLTIQYMDGYRWLSPFHDLSILHHMFFM